MEEDPLQKPKWVVGAIDTGLHGFCELHGSPVPQHPVHRLRRAAPLPKAHGTGRLVLGANLPG